MSTHPHPAADRLALLLHGGLSAEERRAVVRHLLTGCRLCTAVTRVGWAEIERLATCAGRRRASPGPRGLRLRGSRRVTRFSMTRERDEP
jgi:hypothetical protein